MNTRTTLRGAAVGLVATLALLLGASPAFAHAEFESSDPADGASLATGPSTISVTFSDTMQQGFNELTVIGPDGTTHYENGEVLADGDTVSVGVNPLGPAGRYQIGYRVLSDDGHPVSGSVAFTLTAPGPAAAQLASSAAAAPAPADAAPAPVAQQDTGSGGSPVWPWIVGAVVLVAAGVFVAMRLGRGGSEG
ncbi:MAG: copper resistance protein CopC [Pseudonocardia sp.]|uniref:copper resistance CopC family protein n=1 Tax=Pseudonocardia sp. TaxID=60912 RepID=UPI002629045C|nr:copper resistance CopC family protein [Pseudonocardia sp.]MCU1625418.1 copper resistance protein CopC [Pseudonocardia sp.]